jgi:hypothetical protein
VLQVRGAATSAMSGSAISNLHSSTFSCLVVTCLSLAPSFDTAGHAYRLLLDRAATNLQHGHAHCFFFLLAYTKAQGQGGVINGTFITRSRFDRNMCKLHRRSKSADEALA